MVPSRHYRLWLLFVTILSTLVAAVENGSCTDDGTCDARDIMNPDQVAEAKVADECVDNYESCDMWSSKGECEANPKYMLTYCRKSCALCGDM